MRRTEIKQGILRAVQDGSTTIDEIAEHMRRHRINATHFEIHRMLQPLIDNGEVYTLRTEPRSAPSRRGGAAEGGLTRYEPAEPHV